MRYSALEEFSKKIGDFATIETIRAIDRDKLEFEINLFDGSKCARLLVCIQEYFFSIGELIVSECINNSLKIWFECQVRNDYM